MAFTYTVIMRRLFAVNVMLNLYVFGLVGARERNLVQGLVSYAAESATEQQDGEEQNTPARR